MKTPAAPASAPAPKTAWRIPRHPHRRGSPGGCCAAALGRPRMAVSRLLNRGRCRPPADPRLPFLRLPELFLELGWRASHPGQPSRARRPANSAAGRRGPRRIACPASSSDGPGAHGTLVRPTRQLFFEPGLLLRRANVTQASAAGTPAPCARTRRRGHTGQKRAVSKFVHEQRLGIGLEQEPVLASLSCSRSSVRFRSLPWRPAWRRTAGRASPCRGSGPGGRRLSDEHADGAGHRSSMGPNPVDRRRPDQLDLSAPLELRVHFRRDQQRLARPEHVLGEPLAGSLTGSRCRPRPRVRKVRMSVAASSARYQSSWRHQLAHDPWIAPNSS